MMDLHCKSVHRPYHICLIGAGALGSRHLQAMAALNNTQIVVVEPSAQAVEIAKLRWQEVQGQGLYVTFVPQLPEQHCSFDLAVIATSASVRFAVLKQLVEKHTVANLILEKVLFCQLTDYEAAQKLLQQYKIPAWVNCTRRAFDLYQNIRKSLNGATELQTRVTGGDWGMGCNSIHFIDLISYLANDVAVASIDTTRLYAGSKPSKRAGYIEFYGAMQVKFTDGSVLEMCSEPFKQRHIVEIRTAETVLLVDEVQRQYLSFYGDQINWQIMSIDLPPTSKSMTAVFLQILEEKKCNLPTFNESVALHIPVIKALSTHLGGEYADTGFCPIT